MRVLLTISGILFLTVTVGCNTPSNKPLTQKQKDNLWIGLSIKTNNSECFLNAATDSLIVRSLDSNNTSNSYKLSHSEKDSLFSWTEMLIDNKIKPTRYCTDYFGSLSLKIAYSEQMTKQISYKSICEWEELDSNTNKIHNLISKIVTIK